MESATASEAAAETGSHDGLKDAEPPSFEGRRPADGSLISSIDVASPQRVADAVARARTAQPEWEAIGLSGRRRWLDRLRDWMIANHDRLADLMQEETG